MQALPSRYSDESKSLRVEDDFCRNIESEKVNYHMKCEKVDDPMKHETTMNSENILKSENGQDNGLPSNIMNLTQASLLNLDLNLRNDVNQCLLDTTTLCWAAMTGNYSLLKQLVDGGANVNSYDYDKRTPLHIAVSENHYLIVKYLLESGALVDKRDRWGLSALNYAIQYSDFKMIEILKFYSMKDDCNGDMISMRHRCSLPTKNNIHSTHVFQAARDGDVNGIKNAWINGFQVDLFDDHGRTPLHIAVENGQHAVVELLVSAGGNIYACDNVGATPYSMASKEGKSNMLEILKSRRSKDENRGNNLAKCFSAVKLGDLGLLRSLMDGSFHVNDSDYDQRTLLHIAASEGYLDVTTYLVEIGAKVNVVDRWGNTPFSEAQDFAHNDVAFFLKCKGGSRIPYTYDFPGSLIDPDEETIQICLQYILKSICRPMGPWLFGEAYYPSMVAGRIVLVSHCFWHRNSSAQEDTGFNETTNPDDMAIDGITSNNPKLSESAMAYRRQRGNFAFDPGYGHIGRVYNNKEPEWLRDLGNVPQDKFFFAPLVRNFDLLTILSVPMLHNDDVVAVLSWYSKEDISEDTEEIRRIQYLVQSVYILAKLRNGIRNGGKQSSILRYPYCQALENAITCHGVHLDQDKDNNSIPLALQWSLFDPLDQLATSFESEDHMAVINLLTSLAKMIKNGIKGCSIEDEESLISQYHHNGKNINSKEKLFGRTLYCVRYLWTVSPPEGKILSICERILSWFESSKNEDVNNAEKEEEITCVLCKYRVPGHIHSGKPQISPERTRMISGNHRLYFQTMSSPIFQYIQDLPHQLLQELNDFPRQEELLVHCCDTFHTSVTSRDIYDTIGAAHSVGGGVYKSRAQAARVELIDKLNGFLESDEGWNPQILIDLHGLLDLEIPSHKGQIRNHAAVGYASPQIYRVFVPAEEIQRALEFACNALRSDEISGAHPLLASFFMFSVIVFYIHPFLDGNGRLARLVGNIIARKSGYPMILKCTDKTIKFHEFLSKGLSMMELMENERRARQARAGLKKDRTSAWF